MKHLAGISIDVDPIHTHLQGYGIPNAGLTARPVYERGIARALELLSQNETAATFFFVANDVKAFPHIVRDTVAAGHEIACHSATHQLPFDLSSPERRKLEILDSKKLLEDIAGTEIVGFRAPSWDLSSELLDALAEYGYLYDASSYPSWTALALRLIVRLKSSARAPKVSLPPLNNCWAQAEPHRLSVNQHRIVEIPVSSSRWLRLPYYHTMRFLMPQPLFNSVQRSTLGRKSSVNYILHGVDFIDSSDPGVPADIRRHPGMDWEIDDKLKAISASLQAMSACRRLANLRTVAEELLAEHDEG